MLQEIPSSECPKHHDVSLCREMEMGTHQKGMWKRIIRMRLVLRGFMDLEAFSLDTFSGTAKRTSQRMLASEAACNKDWSLASLDIDKAFLNRLHI